MRAKHTSEILLERRHSRDPIVFQGRNNVCPPRPISCTGRSTPEGVVRMGSGAVYLKGKGGLGNRAKLGSRGQIGNCSDAGKQGKTAGQTVRSLNYERSLFQTNTAPHFRGLQRLCN